MISIPAALAYLERVTSYSGVSSEDSQEHYDEKALEIAQLLRNLTNKRDECVRAIQFALQHDVDGIEFLRCWNEGCADEEWPEFKDWSPT